MRKSSSSSAGMAVGRRTETVEVDNPYFDGQTKASAANPKTVRVERYIRNTPLLAIYERGRLCGPGEHSSIAENRFRAGDRLRGIYERAEIGGSKAIDYSAVKVDVSFSHSDLTTSNVNALSGLATIRKALGDNFQILDLIVCREIRFNEAARLWYGRLPNGRERLELYARLRLSLDLVIDHFEPRRKKERSTIRTGHFDPDNPAS